MTSDPLPLPAQWSKFLVAVDELLDHPVELHCLGGFVLLTRFGSPRATYDLDFIASVPNDAPSLLLAGAGKNTPLAQQHGGLYLERVTIGIYPDSYDERLVDLVTPQLRHLRLRTLEPHDLILAKIGRNSLKDRHDLHFLAEKGLLDASVLEARYHKELRPYLLVPERDDLTLSLWLEEVRDVQRSPRGSLER